MVFLHLICPHAKARWKKEALMEEPPTHPLHSCLQSCSTPHRATKPGCRVFVLPIGGVLLSDGWRFSSLCLDNPTDFYNRLGSKLSLIINRKPPHRTEDKPGIYRINGGDILPRSLLSGVSGDVVPRQSALLESRWKVKAAQIAKSCIICHDATILQLTRYYKGAVYVSLYTCSIGGSLVSVQFC